MFLLPVDEVNRIIVDSEATAIITSPDFLGVVKAASEGADKLKWIISTGPQADGVESLDDLEKAAPGSIVDRDDDDLASLLYTGGTTGRSKGVMITHRNHAVCSKGLHDANYVEGMNSAIAALPLAHAFGLMVTIAGFFAVEQGRNFLMTWFEPNEWCRLIQEFKIQRAAMVPSMIQILLGSDLESYDLSSWVHIGVGAAPLAREVIEEFERRVPSCMVHEGYGCTESGGGASSSPYRKRKIGAVGKPWPGYEFKVLDPTDNEVPVGETGEVCIRSEGVMKGYWKSPEVSEQTLRGGWLHTGDVGKLDEDGYLYIVDRIKDLIIRGGFNIYPRDIEDVLLEHPAVQVAGVVGKPDPTYGEEVVGFVQLHQGKQVTTEELTEFTKTKLGRHKYPRDLRILGFLPLTPVGKVDRKALRQML
jgi:long-chain acyl-CoA synthetase